MGWILDSYGLVFWILMGFRLDLDWLVHLVGLAWWAMVVVWWVMGCLVVFAIGFAGVLVGFVFLFFYFGFFVPVGFWWA